MPAQLLARHQLHHHQLRQQQQQQVVVVVVVPTPLVVHHSVVTCQSPAHAYCNNPCLKDALLLLQLVC
jgi:hypothetical protein